MNIQSSWSIELDDLPEPPLKTRHKKVWKGLVYVYYKPTAYKKCIDTLVAHILEQIDREVINAITGEFK